MICNHMHISEDGTEYRCQRVPKMIPNQYPMCGVKFAVPCADCEAGIRHTHGQTDPEQA